MAPRTRRQAMADRKGKGIMIEGGEPQGAAAGIEPVINSFTWDVHTTRTNSTDRAEEPRSPDRESLASIVQPHEELVRAKEQGIDGAGPSQPKVQEVRTTRPE